MLHTTLEEISSNDWLNTIFLIEDEVNRIAKEIESRELDHSFADSWEHSAQIGDKIDKLKTQKKDLITSLEKEVNSMLENTEEELLLRNELVGLLKSTIKTVTQPNKRKDILITMVQTQSQIKELLVIKDELLAKIAHDKSIP